MAVKIATEYLKLDETQFSPKPLFSKQSHAVSLTRDSVTRASTGFGGKIRDSVTDILR